MKILKISEKRQFYKSYNIRKIDKELKKENPQKA
jgi:hypothetical protein